MTDTSLLPWYAQVEHWLTSNQTFNTLGWLCWLAKTAYPIAVCMHLNEAFTNSFFLPMTLLYAWHECVQFVFVVVNWREYVPLMHQQGIEVMRECSQNEVDLLMNVYTQTNQINARVCVLEKIKYFI